jgi:Big-like domain-containing protein
MCFTRLTLVTLVLPLMVATAACGDRNTLESPGGAEAALALRADVSGTLAAVVVVQVTAPDITTPLVFDIPIAGGVAAGTITVPAGSSRTITLRAYDAGGVLTHRGSATVNIQEGTNPTLSIVLTPLTGTLPITATLGAFVVTVTPALDSLGLAGNRLGHAATAQLTATIKDAQGNPASGAPAWATLNPGVAIVDGFGLVTASGTGSTTISAVFQGVTGTATIIVTP